MKKIITLFCALALTLLCAACQSETKTEVIPLTDEEAEILELMGEDVNVIPENEYVNMVTELQAHIGQYNGQVYQLEGIFTTTTLNGEETPFVYRTLVHNGEKTQCGLPLRYLTKEIPDGSWTRVSAIINSYEYGGEPYTVMEVVAVETLAKPGGEELDWDGVGHTH